MVAVEAPHGVDADWCSASFARPVGLLGTFAEGGITEPYHGGTWS